MPDTYYTRLQRLASDDLEFLHDRVVATDVTIDADAVQRFVLVGSCQSDVSVWTFASLKEIKEQMLDNMSSSYPWVNEVVYDLEAERSLPFTVTLHFHGV